MSRKWLRGWLLRSLLLGVISASLDVFGWGVRKHHPMTTERLLNDLLIALVMAWLFVQPNTAWLVYILSWIVSAILCLIVYLWVDRSTHLSPTADAVFTHAATLLPALIGIGAVLLWQRTKRR